MKSFLNGGLVSKEECKQMIIYSDSNSAIKLSENESINHRNKHIEITFHYVWDVVSRDIVYLRYVWTNEMVSDVLTKPLDRDNFEKCVKLCGLQSQVEHLCK